MSNNNIEFCDLRRLGRYDITISSDIGNRSEQQDCAYVAADDNNVFAIICDGMGGMNGGTLASSTTVEAFTEYYLDSGETLQDNQWMQKAAEIIDDIVYSLTDEQGEHLGGGSTVVTVTISDDKIQWFSAGDSRMYIIREKEMVQVTNDHNYFMLLDQQLKEGHIDFEKYRQEAVNGEALISYMGIGGLRIFDMSEVPFSLQSGDIILLCTDGLYRTISDDELKQFLLKYEDMQEASEKINQYIRQKAVSWQDNYTYAIIKINEGNV